MSIDNDWEEHATKGVDTVVEDIYEVMDKGFYPTPENMKSFVDDMTAAIVKQTVPDQRQHGGHLRMSNIGKGDRQVWYDVIGNDTKEELTPDTRLKFLFGDMIEALLIFLVKEAGHDVTMEQHQVEIEGIKGHIDCKIDGAMVDIKSASSYSFKKFVDNTLSEPGNDAFGYMAQISGYAYAEKSEDCGFLVMDKTLGKLVYMPVDSMDRIDPVSRIKHLKDVIADTDTPPPPCHEPVADGKSGNMKLGVNCSYCAHKTACWSDANDGQGLRLFIYSNGPRWLTNVAVLPRTIELDKDGNDVTTVKESK